MQREKFTWQGNCARCQYSATKDKATVSRVSFFVQCIGQINRSVFITVHKTYTFTHVAYLSQTKNQHHFRTICTRWLTKSTRISAADVPLRGLSRATIHPRYEEGFVDYRPAWRVKPSIREHPCREEGWHYCTAPRLRLPSQAVDSGLVMRCRGLLLCWFGYNGWQLSSNRISATAAPLKDLLRATIHPRHEEGCVDYWTGMTCEAVGSGATMP